MRTKNMKIALYGIGGTYNFGCEAIVRGTDKIIHRAYPDATIDYYSYAPVEDEKRLQGCNVQIVPVRKKGMYDIAYRIVCRFARSLNQIRGKCVTLLPERMLFSWVKDYDAILSIGGDIYTLPPKQQRAEFRTHQNSLIRFGEYCNKNNKRLVVWGASVGPFDEDDQCAEIFMSHFRRCISQVVARENGTMEYLKSKGYGHCILFADPAYTVHEENEGERNVSPILGINLSPLSNRYGDEQKEEADILHMQAGAIANLARKTGYSVRLFPHVYSKSAEDDDLTYLQKLEPLLIKENIVCETCVSNSFLGLKSKLQECKIVISARMHCAINAITLGVPTIFLSYSSKAKEMCKMVYDSEEYALPVSDLYASDDVVQVVESMLSDYETIESS